MVLHLCSGALQVPDSSMGSAVMLADCVGAGGVCTELRPAGNKVTSIPRVGDAISELWKPSWAWVNCNSHILCSDLDRLPLTGVKAAICNTAFFLCGYLRENPSKKVLFIEKVNFFYFFFFSQNCQKWLVCSQILSNQTLKNQSLNISVKMIQVC